MAIEKRPTTEDALEHVTAAEVTARMRWNSSSEPLPFRVLDLAFCRQALAQAGLAIDDLDEIADALAVGERPKGHQAAIPEHAKTAQATTAKIARWTAIASLASTGAFLLLWSGAPNADTATAAATATTIGQTGLAISAVCLAVAFAAAVLFDLPSRRKRAVERARQIIETHTCDTAEVRADYQQVIEDATDAAHEIEATTVWSSDLFDAQRVRIDLTEEVAQIRSRILRLASIEAMLGYDQSISKPITGTTRRRVLALQRYRDEVLACDQAAQHLAAAESMEHNVDRLTDLLASTGADQSHIEALQARAAEAAATGAALREVLSSMAVTAAELTPAPITGAMRPAQRAAQG